MGEYEDDLAAVRASFAREHEQAVRAGAVTPRYGSNVRPRRKRGYEVWCANDSCRNGIWGLAGAARDDEYPTWLDGRRKDAAFCSNACRQHVYRLRQKQEREEWLAIIDAWRPVAAQVWTDTEGIPNSDWKTWRHLITIMVEAYEANEEEKASG